VELPASREDERVERAAVAALRRRDEAVLVTLCELCGHGRIDAQGC